MFDAELAETGWATDVPSADLARRLEGADVAALGDDDLVEVIAGWDRLASWAQARQARAIAVFAARRPPVGSDDHGVGVSEFAADELAVALRLSRPAAATRLHTALDLAGRLPATLQAFSTGGIDAVKARSVVDATRPLTPAQATVVEHRVLPRAPSQTLGQLRAALARAVIAADPGGAQHRHEQAYADRRVVLTPTGNGMAELWALLRAADATALYHRLTTLAKKSPRPRSTDPRSTDGRSADGRSMDARRADALAGLAHHRGPGEPAPALVQVTVAATTLLGADQQPAHLTGYGPITAGEARRIAADGRWRRLLTDPATGALLDYGRRSYPPPAALADHIRARDQTCRFPGCRQPAATADLDHTTPYPTGPTAATNLTALCRHHHRLKHRAGWTVKQEDGATLTWTTPTGRQHTTSPPAIGAIQADSADGTEATAGIAVTDDGVATTSIAEQSDDP